MIAEIAFPVPLRKTFYYRVGEADLATARPGLRVLAPFGPRTAAGMVMAVHDDVSVDLGGFRELKSLGAFLDRAPVFKDDIPAIARWMLDRWNAPPGLAAENFFGQFMGEALPFSPSADLSPSSFFSENTQPDLRGAGLMNIADGLSKFVPPASGPAPEAHVLLGPPQYGRYDIYVELARKAVLSGGQFLCLVPDLNLIAPLEERLNSVFKSGAVALWHSRLTPKQRRETWHAVRTGAVRGILGARSAVFLPFGRLSLALVDEEQDDIYKQEEQEPNFHARELLLRRARYHGSCVVLASAAPSMETYSAWRTGRFSWAALPAPAAPRPEVSIVDMNNRRWEIISGTLSEKIRAAVAGKRQALVLAARKGYAPLSVCANCGWIKRCGRCRVPMGIKKEGDEELFVCWRCGRKEPPPETCPACSGKVFRDAGAGTQKIEALLKKLLPGARVARCDGDVLRRSVKDARAVYEEFRKGGIDVLVGTRLLARGHDFPGLGLIGVVDYDSGLSAADFRASEKIFQTLFEAGSALFETRASGPEFIVQTRQPGHYVFSVLPELDYLKFAGDELSARKDFFYPPFSELVRIGFASLDARALTVFSGEVLSALDAPAGDEAEAPRAEILGPLISREPRKSRLVKEYYLVKLAGEKELAWCLGRLRPLKPPKNVRFRITADPYSFK